MMYVKIMHLQVTVNLGTYMQGCKYVHFYTLTSLPFVTPHPTLELPV